MLKAAIKVANIAYQTDFSYERLVASFPRSLNLMDLSYQAMLRLKRAKPGDAALVAGLLSDAFKPFRPFYTEGGFMATVLAAEVIRTRLDEGPTWLALDDGGAAGTVSAVTRGERLYMRSMAVAMTAQGRGVGSALLNEVERYALSQRLSGIYLSTTPFLDSAIRLYERFGFRRTAEPPCDLFGTPLFTMEKLLQGDSPGASR